MDVIIVNGVILCHVKVVRKMGRQRSDMAWGKYWAFSQKCLLVYWCSRFASSANWAKQPSSISGDPNKTSTYKLVAANTMMYFCNLRVLWYLIVKTFLTKNANRY